MNDKIERRTQKIEYRIDRKEDGTLPRIEGHAAVFNSDSEDMGFIERIKPGAFKEALKISDARALFNHDTNIVLGRQSAGTLELKEDKIGLHMSVQPPDTQLVRDMVLSPIERGDITEQSFGFTIEADEWEGLDTDHPVRTITKIREVFDVSPVTFPAYPDTNVALRSLVAARKEHREAIPVAVPEDDPIKVTLSGGTEFSFAGFEEFDELVDKIREIRPASGSDEPGEAGSDELNDPVYDETTQNLLNLEVD